MAKQSKTPAKAVRQIARLEDIPNVGPAVAGDLRQLGVTSPGELPGRDPYALYDDLCRITGQRHDLPEPITVRAGEAFIAVPGPAAGGGT